MVSWDKFTVERFTTCLFCWTVFKVYFSHHTRIFWNNLKWEEMVLILKSSALKVQYPDTSHRTQNTPHSVRAYVFPKHQVQISAESSSTFKLFIKSQRHCHMLCSDQFLQPRQWASSHFPLLLPLVTNHYVCSDPGNYSSLSSGRSGSLWEGWSLNVTGHTAPVWASVKGRPCLVYITAK